MTRSVSSWELTAIPLFIWMGEIVFRSDISSRLFRGLAPVASRIPGSLFHTNVGGCTLFGAVCGSSAATAATVGQITMKELAARKYNIDLAMGSLAAAGSLGLLIPPSIVLIVYGVVAETSIAKLFTAGILPGIAIATTFSVFLGARCLINPSLAPKSELAATMKEVVRGIGLLWPIFLLNGIVLGAIYTGIATPTEAAAIGVLATLLFILVTGQMTFELIATSSMAAIRTSCMIVSIMVSASLLSTTLGYMHVPINLARAVSESGLSPYQLMLAIGILYLVLGCFLDGVSIIVMTIPIVLPLVVAAGFDPVWFGIFLVVMVEIGQITPPVGFNLFVLQGLTGQTLSRVAWASAPFCLLMLACLVTFTVYPEIVTWLPNLLQP